MRHQDKSDCSLVDLVPVRGLVLEGESGPVPLFYQKGGCLCSGLWRRPHQRLGFLSPNSELFQGREAATQSVCQLNPLPPGERVSVVANRRHPKTPRTESLGNEILGGVGLSMLLQMAASPEDPTHAHEGSVLTKDLRRPHALTAGCTSRSERQEVEVKSCKRPAQGCGHGPTHKQSPATKTGHKYCLVPGVQGTLCQTTI